MATLMDSTATTQVYRVYIQAPAQAVWDAITKPEWAQRYGYGSPCRFDVRPGGTYEAYATPEMGLDGVIIDGEILEVDEPHRLVMTWRAKFVDEGPTRLTYELTEGPGGLTTLTLIHDVTGAPRTAHQIAGVDPNAGGGWAYVLSDLKTLLETGKPFTG